MPRYFYFTHYKHQYIATVVRFIEINHSRPRCLNTHAMLHKHQIGSP